MTNYWGLVCNLGGRYVHQVQAEKLLVFTAVRPCSKHAFKD